MTYGRPFLRASLRAIVIAAIAISVLAACSPSISPPPGSSPLPTPTGATGAIEHATGATDLILRYESGGGFIAPGFLVTEAPQFSLYGDGTAIFRDDAAIQPDPVGNVTRKPPFMAIRLTEEQIQALLAFAVGPGGLGIARAQYELPIADAPTTTFTIIAGGTRKTVSVNGLGIDVDITQNPDGPVLTELANLRARLAGFGSAVGGEQAWAPDRYRGILSTDSFNPPVAWPWKDITPNDFVQAAGQDASPFPIRTMAPAEVAVLGVPGLEGGATGFSFTSPFPAGVLYSFSLRPLLPDEAR
jgi:hypothetical protein